MIFEDGACETTQSRTARARGGGARGQVRSERNDP